MGFNSQELDNIKKYFLELSTKQTKEEVFYYDLEIDAEEITEMDIKEVEKFSRISGKGFSEPKFKIKNLILEEGYTKKLGHHVRGVMGSNNDTIKINCEDGWALMKFKSHSDYAIDVEYAFEDSFSAGVNVIGSLNLNSFYNFGKRETIITKQIFIDDYEIFE